MNTANNKAVFINRSISEHVTAMINKNKTVAINKGSSATMYLSLSLPILDLSTLCKQHVGRRFDL